MEYRIPYNVPPYLEKSAVYMAEAASVNHKICGDGPFTARCSAWLKEKTGSAAVLLTTSCTHALEMAAHMCHFQPGDEVIMSSFNFVSAADAAVLCGAVPVFVDIRPDTMNMDETKIEDAITDRTKAIFAMHYAGVACDMDRIMEIAKKYSLTVVEDAAQCLMASYKGRPLGTMGEFGTVSFHETKNYSMGEGGALLIRDKDRLEEAEILREKGTNRSKFFRGEIDKYTWEGYGSSFLPSDLNAAYLLPQLEEADIINNKRRGIWQKYYDAFTPLADAGKLYLPVVPEGCEINGHIFYIRAKSLEERTALIGHLKEAGILSVFHYVPLHTAPAGRKFGRFHGEDVYTTRESERLLRMPLYNSMTDAEVDEVIARVLDFYG